MVKKRGRERRSLRNNSSPLRQEIQPKILSCVFDDKVPCSWRKSEKFGIMDRCLKCRYYEEFLRVMDKEEEEFFEEVDRIRRNEGYGR